MLVVPLGLFSPGYFSRSLQIWQLLISWSKTVFFSFFFFFGICILSYILEKLREFLINVTSLGEEGLEAVEQTCMDAKPLVYGDMPVDLNL